MQSASVCLFLWKLWAIPEVKQAAVQTECISNRDGTALLNNVYIKHICKCLPNGIVNTFKLSMSQFFFLSCLKMVYWRLTNIQIRNIKENIKEKNTGTLKLLPRG